MASASPPAQSPRGAGGRVVTGDRRVPAWGGVPTGVCSVGSLAVGGAWGRAGDRAGWDRGCGGVGGCRGRDGDRDGNEDTGVGEGTRKRAPGWGRHGGRVGDTGTRAGTSEGGGHRWG